MLIVMIIVKEYLLGIFSSRKVSMESGKKLKIKTLSYQS